MTEQEAIQRVRELLGTAATQLFEADLTDAVRQAVTVDAEGRLPGDADWVPAYEPYWAAGVAATMLATRAALAGGVLKWTSEGTTVERQAPDFQSAAAGFFSRSPITDLAAATAAGFIDIPGGPPYDTRSQGWRGE